MSGYPGGEGYQQMHNPSEGPTGPTGGDKEQPQWKRYLSICTLVLGAVVGLVMLVISIVAYGQMAGFVSDYESTVDSWQTLPVTAIAFVNGQSSCPAGSEFVGSNWPGLYPACNCDVPGHTGNSTSSPTTVCDNQQLADHCVTLPSAHTLPVALNVFPATLMCVTRGGVDALSRQPDPTNCGAGQFVCGAGSSAFCWPSGSACPITDFVLDSVQYTQSQAGASDSPTEVYTEQPSGTKWYLYVKRGGVLNNLWPNRMGGAFNFTGLPVVDVTFQPSDPCTLSGCGYSGRAAEYAAMARAYHANAATAGFGYTQKPLPCDGGCMAPDVSNSVSPSGRDVRYSRTNYGVTETALYTAASGVPQQFITSNPNYQWYVQYRTEIEWSLRCPESRADVVRRQSDVEKVRTAQVVLLVFGILSFIFLSLYFPCIEVFGKPQTKERLSKCNLGCKIVIKSTTLVCTIVTVVVAYGTLAFWDAVNRDAICSDALTDETFQTLGRKFNDLSYKNAITTASAGATSIADIFVACANKFV